LFEIFIGNTFFYIISSITIIKVKCIWAGILLVWLWHRRNVNHLQPAARRLIKQISSRRVHEWNETSLPTTERPKQIGHGNVWERSEIFQGKVSYLQYLTWEANTTLDIALDKHRQNQVKR